MALKKSDSKATWCYPHYIAHRGAGTLAPENTLTAFRVGFAHGYRMFECDVKLSANGVAYLLHDDTLTRCTDGNDSATNWAWTDLAQLDAGSWHSAAYAGEPLPTLRSIAAFVRANDCDLNIEIKPIPGKEAHTGEVIAHLAAQLWAGSVTLPLISSFSEAALEAAYHAQPNMPRALLVDAIPTDWQAKLTRLDCVALACNVLHVSADQISAVKAAGYRMLVYTCGTPEHAAQLLAWGVDAVITDTMDAISAKK